MPEWDRPLAERLDGDFYGFDHIEVAADHADRASGDYLLWARAHHPDFDGLVGPENALPDNRINAPQAWRTAVPEELYSTNWIADRSEAWLGNRAQEDAPFFLQMSFPDPHHPVTPPSWYWDMYDPLDIALPKSFGTGDLPPIKAMRAAMSQGTDPRGNQSPFAVTEDEARAIIALTYDMITMIDDAMRPSGPVAQDGLASSIEISATILARAGIQPFNGLQGRDFFGSDPPDAIIVEEDSQRTMTGFDRPQRVRTLVTDQYRMSLRHGEDWGELFDLKADPEEVHNLYADAAAAGIKSALTETMLRRMIALQDRAPLPAYRA